MVRYNMAKTTGGLIDLYLKDNYENDISLLTSFIDKKYKGRFKKTDIKDIYHDSIIRVIESKSYKNNNISDIKGFVWITLRNEIVRVLKKKKLDLEYLDGGDINDFSNLPNDDFFVQNGFDNLMNDIKSQLTPQEYWILVNYIYNKLSYKQISVIIGYSKQYVYCKNKLIVDKIKKLIDENREEYF